MLIDDFNEDFFNGLTLRTEQLSASSALYLLIDAAFVPGLHRALPSDCKSLLFASLPGCNDETADASPFLTPYIPNDARMRSILLRCNAWPMVGLIETPESQAQISERLASWCVVEADGQRFNFRFPDTRRLPAIFRTLDATQRAQFTGPATRWSYVNREGRWDELDVTGVSAEPTANPGLDSRQFAALVDDSRADEVLLLLGDRGCEVGKHPSVSHARVSAALFAAGAAGLADDDVLDWCEWYWQHAAAGNDRSAVAALPAWRNAVLMEK